MAVAAANCPTMATEVWNACAKVTRSGPSISAERLTRKTATQSRMSSTAGDAWRDAMSSSSSHDGLCMAPNAGAHLPPESEARHEQRLEAVRCSALLAGPSAPGTKEGLVHEREGRVFIQSLQRSIILLGKYLSSDP